MSDDPPPLTERQLDTIQGDVWSKGFPKYYETYYFFSINSSNTKIFAKCLNDLATKSPPLISSLRKVRDDRVRIDEETKAAIAEARGRGIPEEQIIPPRIPISNALIAFTSKGLKIVSYLIKDIPSPSAKLL